MTDLSLVPQLVVNGLVIGSVLALAGIGLSLVYGILNLANFAHGDFVALGAFLAYLFAILLYGDLAGWGLAVAAALLLFPALDHLWTRRLARGERLVMLGLGAPLAAVSGWVTLAGPGGAGTTSLLLLEAGLLSVIFSVAALLAIELLVWRPLRRKKATILTLVIVSIGVSLVVRNLLQLGFGPGNKSFARPTPVSPEILGVLISAEQQFTLVASVLLIVGVHLFLTRARTGKAMRAMADNLDLARVSGVEVDRVVGYVWVLTAALTAVSGVLLTLIANNVMNINMGLGLLLPLFATVILGGIGSPYGAMAGGFIVGVSMKTATLWIGTKYEFAAALVVLIVVLFLRPQGLFGGKAA